MNVSGAAQQPGTSEKIDREDKRSTPAVRQVQNLYLEHFRHAACTRRKVSTSMDEMSLMELK